MREGLMDDTGYHGFDDAEYFGEHYCMRCKNQPVEADKDGNLWAVECEKNCTLAEPSCFEEIEE